MLTHILVCLPGPSRPRPPPPPPPPPQVMLGIPYTSAIDLWSAGCVAAELVLGLPLFPGCHEADLLLRVTRLLGPLPDWMVATGPLAGRFFTQKGVEREGGGDEAGRGGAGGGGAAVGGAGG